MRRIFPLAMLWTCGMLAAGCDLPGWYRAVGHYPGVAPSDYAFYDFCGVSSQVFQFSPERVQSAAVEALRDMGFYDFQPPTKCPDGTLDVTLKTPDGRDAKVSFSPQNRMTNMRFTAGPLHVGDEMLARDVFRRVALNFGTLPRSYLPLEPTLARRLNPPPTMPPEVHGPGPLVLEGEGLRPGDQRNSAGPEYIAPVTGTGSGVIPQPFDPLRPYMPGSAYPVYPFDYFNSPYFAPPIPMQ